MQETIIQFGTGNFLRAFAEHFIHILNEKGLYNGKIVIVQPTKGGKARLINQQGGRYNLFLRGIENGEEVSAHTEIKSVSRAVDPYEDFKEYLALAENPEMRFIVSNTTEAGIAFDESCQLSDKPALSFPGKLTQLLYHRFTLGMAGFVILPCELIDGNGDELFNCVMRYAALWSLGEDFCQWLRNENKFCNTLVDRIVTGYPKDEAGELCKTIGYDDKLLDTAEIFHLWVIEGDFEQELPMQKAGLNVVWTDDAAPYKRMKVRILNGAHTSLVFPSLFCGAETVGESLRDAQLSEYLNICLFDYILPALGDTEENRTFASAVLDRFANPYIKHLWKSISLNSVSKFAARVLPALTDYEEKYGEIPKPLVFSLACLIEYYKGNDVQDDTKIVEFIKESNIGDILSDIGLWGKDLSALTALTEECIEKIHIEGIRGAIAWAVC